MLYFIAKFALYLLLALFVGVVIGWLIWGGDPFEVTSPVAAGDQAEVQELAAQIESKDQEIARLRKRLKRVHTDLDARDAHVLAAKTTNDELSTLLSQREDELLSLRRTHDGLLEQVAAGGAVITDPQLERRMSELEEDLAASRAEAQRLGQQLEALNSAAPVSADEDEVRRAVDTAVQHSVAEATAALASVQQQLQTAEADRASLAAELERAHRDLDEAARRIVEQEQQLAAAPAGSGDGTPEVSRLQAELTRAKQSVTTWRQRLEEVEDENNRLAGDLAEAHTLLSTSQAELAAKADASGGLVAENERLVAQVASMQDELGALRRDLAARQHELDTRQQELAARQQELDTALASASAAEDVRTENERLSGELTRLRNGVIGLDERAAKAEADVVRLQGELAQAQSEGSAQLSALHVELSDARLRADAAHEALQELTNEFVQFRDITLRQQSTVQSLSDRLDRARSTLVGRRPLATEPDDEVPAPDDLLRLPGITKLLAAHLSELGVTGYDEVGSWSEADVERYNTMLEANGIISQNDWPAAARRLWEEQNHLAWGDRVESRRS